jgi:hypothetical protein
MADISQAAQLVGSLGSVAVAAVAIIINSRTTRDNLKSQRQSAGEQLRAQQAALETTLRAQSQQIRDERLWDRRMALYEDLGAWSGEAFAGTSRLMFETEALPSKDFLKNFEGPLKYYDETVGNRYFPLFGRVQLYASDAVRDAYQGTSSSVTRLHGKYDKKTVSEWVTSLFIAVTSLQDELRATIDRVSLTDTSSMPATASAAPDDNDPTTVTEGDQQAGDE